jgi:hypothetical protein
MMSVQHDFLDSARKTQTAASDAVALWGRSLRATTDQARRPLSLFQPRTVIRQCIDMARELEEINRDSLINLMRAAGMTGEVLAEHASALAAFVGHQGEALSERVHAQLVKAA